MNPRINMVFPRKVEFIFSLFIIRSSVAKLNRTILIEISLFNNTIVENEISVRAKILKKTDFLVFLKKLNIFLINKLPKVPLPLFREDERFQTYSDSRYKRTRVSKTNMGSIKLSFIKNSSY